MAVPRQAGADHSVLLAEKGLRVTKQRLEVLAELARERDDVTAQSLWRRLRERDSHTGLATVYRTLSLLHEKGVIDSFTHHGTELCYRLCTDAHHHHLLCTACHRVVEIEQCGIDGWIAEVTSRHGFVATEHRVEIAGVCGDCR